MSQKIRIRSTVRPSKSANTFKEWTDWLIKDHTRRWKEKIRSNYATSKCRV